MNAFRTRIAAASLRPGVEHALATLKRLERVDARGLKAFQRERLAGILEHAWHHVPFYRERLGDVGAVRDGTADLSAFDAIPPLTKRELQDDFERLLSDDRDTRRWFVNSTGGSTGQPVRFVQDDAYAQRTYAIKILREAWAGRAPGQPKALLWGSERDLFEGGESLRARLKNWVLNDHWMNAFRMDTSAMRSHLRTLERVRPTLLLGYVDALYELARFARSEGIEPYSPGAIMTGAGTLHDEMRTQIDEVFDAPVFNRYGCREFGSIASDCDRHEGLHVSSPNLYLELLDDAARPVSPERAGVVTATSLINRSMPLIRYQMGDLATWSTSPCSCGRSWPLLDTVVGREGDVFVRPDGGVVLPQYLIHLVGVVLNRGWIATYQVVQDAPERVRVRIVPREADVDPAARYAADLTELRAKVRLVMGDGCDVAFEFPDAIAPTPSGKHRYTISHVRSDGGLRNSER